jgi:hypothetical protein
MIDWIIIVVGSIIVTGHFAFSHGMRKGVEFGTEMTINELERVGIIDVDEEGNVTAKKRTTRKKSV